MKKKLIIILPSIVLVLTIGYFGYYFSTTQSVEKIFVSSSAPLHRYGFPDSFRYMPLATESSTDGKDHLYLYRKVKFWPLGWYFDRYRLAVHAANSEKDKIGSLLFSPLDDETNEKKPGKTLVLFWSRHKLIDADFCEYTILENGIERTERQQTGPFQFYIVDLGTVKGVTRELVDAKFYNEDGALLYIYIH